MTNTKCELWARSIQEKLALRLGSTYHVTKQYDSSSDIYVSVALVAGGNNSVRAIVKLAPVAAPASAAYDLIGHAQKVYTPHVASVAFDITASVGTTDTEKFWVLRQILALGTRVDLYEKSVGASNLVVADIAAGNFVVGAENIADDGMMSSL